MTPGIHLLHKPVGATSFALVRELQEQAARENPGKFPLCHGGTLDPFAEGLLLILAGQATRLMDLVHAVPKVYVATLSWGSETDNLDPTGKVVAQGDATALDAAALDAALSPFLGWTLQIPPSTSAKKIGGEPAYRKVHRGEAVTLPPSRVFLHRARWLSHDLPRSSTLELACRGGYYVRALARDLGRSLGCTAHLSGLCRTAIGPYQDPGPGGRGVATGTQVLPWCPSRAVDDAEAADLARGQAIPLGEVRAPDWPVPEGFPDPQGPVRALHAGRLVAVLRQTEGKLQTFANLRGGL